MAKPKYAAQTTVSPEKSLIEIKSTLNKYGATQFMFAEEAHRALIMFYLKGRLIKMEIPFPNLSEFSKTANGKTRRNPKAAYEQTIRQLWRATALGIKAKLEFVNSGIRTIEQEFLGDVVLPNDQTVYQWIQPQLIEEQMPKALPFLEGPSEKNKSISSPSNTETY